MMSGAAGGAGLDVDDVFSTYVYAGSSATKTINNGIDLTGEGGLTWFKCRNVAMLHNLFDTERGNTQRLASSTTSAQSAQAAGRYPTYTSTGFTLGADTGGDINYSGRDYVSWTFRKAPKFFDIVTYTGNGAQGRAISHNLGSAPGFLVVKKTNASGNWPVYHRGMTSALYGMQLNSTNDQFDADSYWDSTDPTASVFTVGNNADVNASGSEYVAYLFAHNNGDGEYGPDGDQDIIKCGSYTGSGSSGLDVNFGFEPQFVLIKNISGSNFWTILMV